MLVAIRIRPLNGQEINRDEQEIIRAEDKLLVSPFFSNFTLFRLFLTVSKWSAKMREKSRTCSTGRESRGTTSTGSLITSKLLSRFMRRLVRTWSTLFSRVITLAFSHMEPQALAKLTPWPVTPRPPESCTSFSRTCSAKFSKIKIKLMISEFLM